MNRDVLKHLLVGAGILVLALIASYARSQGLIDHETTTRIVIVAIGLMVIWQGDRIPKTFTPSAYARKVQRFTGWSQVIGGLIFTAAFAFAPMDLAVVIGVSAILGALVLSLIYCLTLRYRSPA